MDDEEFTCEARDRGGEPVVMLTGTAKQCRTKMVLEAGLMAAGGWMALNTNRNSITMQSPDDAYRQTFFRLRKITADAQPLG